MVLLNQKPRGSDMPEYYLIKEELDRFFNRRIESARRFSLAVTLHQIDYTKAAFEQMVISENGVSDCIRKISESLEISVNLLDNHFYSVEQCYFILSKFVKQYRTTKIITNITENIIDFSASTFLGEISSSSAVDFITGNLPIGSWLLGDNNQKEIAVRFYKGFSQRIEGLLCNTKIEIRNNLANQYYSCLNVQTIA